MSKRQERRDAANENREQAQKYATIFSEGVIDEIITRVHDEYLKNAQNEASIEFRIEDWLRDDGNIPPNYIPDAARQLRSRLENFNESRICTFVIDEKSYHVPVNIHIHTPPHGGLGGTVVNYRFETRTVRK